MHLGTRVTWRAIRTIEHEDVGVIREAPSQVPLDFRQARTIARRHLHHVWRSGQPIVADHLVRGEKLDGLARLHVARAVGVEVVEESAGDDGARRPETSPRRVIVSARDDEDELREGEVDDRLLPFVQDRKLCGLFPLGGQLRHQLCIGLIEGHLCQNQAQPVRVVHCREPLCRIGNRILVTGRRRLRLQRPFHINTAAIISSSPATLASDGVTVMLAQSPASSSPAARIASSWVGPSTAGGLARDFTAPWPQSPGLSRRQDSGGNWSDSDWA